jgi:hypothetical protein
MTPARDFGLLRERATASLNRMRTLALNACAAANLKPQRVVISHVAIELLNLWASFCRSYFLSCILRPRRVTGGRVLLMGPAVNSFDDAITVSIRRHKPHLLRRPRPPGAVWHRRDEPPWHDPAILRTGCADLRCSHEAHVQASLALPTRAFVDLPVFRNFFGHRNGQSAYAARQTARSYLISPALHPTFILAERPNRRPYPLLVDWLDDVSAIVSLLCD